MKRSRIQINKGAAFAGALVLVISMFAPALNAEELGHTQSVTIPGATPAVHFEFDDDNPLTPPVVFSANNVEGVTLTYGWNATNPADVLTVIGKAKKCHPHSLINQVIKISLKDAGATLEGSISWKERDSSGDLVGEHFFRFAGETDWDGGRYDLSLCVR